MGESSQKASKSVSDLRVSGHGNSTKVPMIWCVCGCVIVKRKREQSRGSVPEVVIKLLFYKAFRYYLKYLLSIPSRALPWRASSRAKCVQCDVVCELKPYGITLLNNRKLP